MGSSAINAIAIALTPQKTLGNRFNSFLARNSRLPKSLSVEFDTD
jgi:hypothetical protein